MGFDMSAKRFRKKPVVIEAMEFTDGDHFAVIEWMRSCGCTEAHINRGAETIAIPTLEGVMLASVGDWIIKGVADEFYPCRNDIFDKTYEKAD